MTVGVERRSRATDPSGEFGQEPLNERGEFSELMSIPPFSTILNFAC